VSPELSRLAEGVARRRAEVEAAGETFYPGASRIHLAAFPPRERWDDWTELDSKSWPRRSERRFMLVPTTCFNCESACGLLAYVDRESLTVRKFEGNPEHPGSRGRNCAKGPATLNQITDPDRILRPLRRAGARGEDRWTEVSWDEVLDDLAGRIRGAVTSGRQNEIMYHVGRPGEDGFTERVLAAWGVDGHNSHTNICSSGGRAGYEFWMGMDRPSPDHARSRLMLLVSAHLEAGHYFNPHAQRITEARAAGAKLVVLDTRLSNTATHADHWLATQPGSEAALLLAIARDLVARGRHDRDFVRRWWNWEEYLRRCRPDLEPSFENFEQAFLEAYAEFTFEYAAQESGISADVIEQVSQLVAEAGSQLSTHTWRSATAGNLGGWQVARCLFLLNALMGAVATPGGTFPNAWNKYVPRPIHTPPHPPRWNSLTWPLEYPLALNEMSFLLPHFLKEGRGHLELYFSRVYNPVWTNPGGFDWVQVLSDESLIGCYAALTPTWNESAYFADYVLPMGHASERHDVHSYETHNGRWLGFRQPVLRAAQERLGRPVLDTREVNPGQVWEENEFWIELSWRVDPDGSLGIRRWFESRREPGTKLGLDEYYAYMFENSVPGLPERAAAEGLTPLQFMRRYGAFEIDREVGALHEEEPEAAELEAAVTDKSGRVYTSAAAPPSDNLVPISGPAADAEGRRPLGVRIDGVVRRGFPTPSGRLEFYSSTLAEWGWPEHAIPGYIKSHVHPERLAQDQMVLISTFRLPVQVHTRSANSKWLDEIAHTNPLWLHPRDAERLGGIHTGDSVRVETEIGHFVLRAWVTEGIRPGVVACSHHMGRWRLSGSGSGQRQLMAEVTLEREGSNFGLHRRSGAAPYASSDPDTSRIWWRDVGVHQNLTFAVQPDPISGQHCWHQAVRVSRARPEDAVGDVQVDLERSHLAYLRWLELTRPASLHSPDGTRRPRWLLRPLKPAPEHFELPQGTP